MSTTNTIHAPIGADNTLPPTDRSLDRLRAHYEIEKELAAKLMDSTREQRRTLYSSLYNELFMRVPDHPQLVNKESVENRRKYVDEQLKLLGQFLQPSMKLIEIGPGDCTLAIRACSLVRQVYAVDVSSEITRRSDLPKNFELYLSDGVTVPSPPGGVDVVYSNQLMEHLHPEDASAQLNNVVSALASGGAYVCVTPNRLTGPHDISVFFSDVAQGFHLKEYTASELIDSFKAAGFKKVQVYAAIKDRYFALPHFIVRSAESILERSSAATRRKLSKLVPFRWLSTICMVGRKG